MAVKAIKKIFYPPALAASLFTIALFCIVLATNGHQQPQLFNNIDDRIFDTMFKFRGSRDTTGSVVIVNIDDKSLKQHGQWPWPRDLVAQLTDRIFDANPVVVGFDIMFAEKDRTSPSLLFENFKDHLTLHPTPNQTDLTPFDLSLDHDLLLAKAIGRGNSVQGYMFLFREDFQKETPSLSPRSLSTLSIDQKGVAGHELKLVSAYRPIMNIDELNTAKAEGFLNVVPDSEGGVRKIPLFIAHEGTPYPSITLEMYRLVQQQQGARIHTSSTAQGNIYPLEGISVGETYFPTDPYGQMAVNFRGPFNTFLYISAADILAGRDSDVLSGKYVIIGSSAAGIMDLVATPFSSRLPGVEVHANILDNLIAGDPMASNIKIKTWLTYCLLIFGGLIMTAGLVFLGPLSGLVVSFAVFSAVKAGNYYFLFLNNQLVGTSFIVVGLLSVFLVTTLFNYLFEGRKRLFIKRAFAHYVAPSIVNDLLKNPSKLDLLVDTREVTILFCDIRNFASLAENSSPEQLSLFLNRYFSLMTEIVLKHQGMVDKYIGDAVMAVWGSPLADSDHALHGVSAASEMIETIKNHAEELQLDGKSIEIGIGINSGPASAGNFGCDKHFDYTVLGDNVNLASRVEDLTKLYPVSILLTECTKNELSKELPCRFIDRVLVKGRYKPVDLFEPLHGERASTFKEKELGLYEKGLDLYRQGDFGQAFQVFDELHQESKEDLYNLYKSRCLMFMNQNPGPNWKGIYDISGNGYHRNSQHDSQPK